MTHRQQDNNKNSLLHRLWRRNNGLKTPARKSTPSSPSIWHNTPWTYEGWTRQWVSPRDGTLPRLKLTRNGTGESPSTWTLPSTPRGNHKELEQPPPRTTLWPLPEKNPERPDGTDPPAPTTCPATTEGATQTKRPNQQLEEGLFELLKAREMRLRRLEGLLGSKEQLLRGSYLTRLSCRLLLNRQREMEKCVEVLLHTMDHHVPLPKDPAQKQYTIEEVRRLDRQIFDIIRETRVASRRLDLEMEDIEGLTNVQANAPTRTQAPTTGTTERCNDPQGSPQGPTSEKRQRSRIQRLTTQRCSLTQPPIHPTLLKVMHTAPPEVKRDFQELLGITLEQRPEDPRRPRSTGDRPQRFDLPMPRDFQDVQEIREEMAKLSVKDHPQYDSMLKKAIMAQAVLNVQERRNKAATTDQVKTEAMEATTTPTTTEAIVALMATDTTTDMEVPEATETPTAMEIQEATEAPEAMETLEVMEAPEVTVVTVAAGDQEVPVIQVDQEAPADLATLGDPTVTTTSRIPTNPDVGPHTEDHAPMMI